MIPITQLSLAATGELLPHAVCFLERPGLIRLHALSDAGIALAYMVIPIILVVMMRRSPALARLRGMMTLFAAFILLCGISHVMDVLTLWHPYYYLQGWEKALTAAVSIATAVALVLLLPVAQRMSSPEVLEAANRQLAEEVAARQNAEVELRRSLGDLGRAVQELEQFAYVTSHDLQAPLRSIMGFSQLLVRRYRDKLDGDALEFLGYIEQGTHQMQSLIQDLLRLSRVGRGESQFESQPLADTVQRALQRLGDTTQAAGARIDYPPDLPTLTADHELLAQLLQQLIGNAIKFRDPGRAPRIGITASPDPDSDGWLLTVSDNGIGIPREQLENIFVVFRRLHGGNEYEGTGIGLAICRKIAMLHGGAIWATSDGQGAQFHLRLPRQPRRPPSAGLPKVTPDVS